MFKFSTYSTRVAIVTLVILFAACQPNAVPSPTNIPPEPSAEPSVPAETEPDSTSNQSSQPAELCSLVSAADVQNITGVSYDSVTTQGNFPNIKHCEYRGQANVVSLVIVSDATATERLNRNKQLAHTAIANFHDEAIWEPVQNLLSVMSGRRLVEVRISKSHGDEPSRIEKAKTLALLAFSY